MSKFERVAAYIVQDVREIEGDELQALDLLSSPIDCALWADDLAERMDAEDLPEGLTSEDFAEFDPRVCKLCAFAMADAIADEFGTRGASGAVVREWREGAHGLDADRSKNTARQ